MDLEVIKGINTKTRVQGSRVCQYNILWYLHHVPVSCLGIPVSGLVFHKKVKQQTYLF